MTILKCPSCTTVVIDTPIDGEYEVKCTGCESAYTLVIKNGRIASLDRLPDKSEVPAIRSEWVGEKFVKTFETVIYEKEGNIARVTLNRPEKLNAINFPMIRDIIAAIDEVDLDDDVSVAIFKGSGRAFSTGGDLEGVYTVYTGERAGGRRPSLRARFHLDQHIFEMFRRARTCWKPIICQAHGYCLGVALMFSHACDITIASEDTKFGHPEQRLGMGGMVTAEEILMIGMKKAREILITGRLIDAKEAERIGWINCAVPADKLEEEVAKLASEIALMPRDGFAIGRISTLFALERLGVMSNHFDNAVMHTICTNIRFEPNEYNFLKGRKDEGARASFHKRDERWEAVK